MNLSPDFLINLSAYVLTGLGAVIAVTWRISSITAKLATKEELKDKVKERDKIIDRVYERFDEFKKCANDGFVRKDMCGQLHISTKSELDRMDKDYKDFRHEIRNTVQMIFDKIDEINRRLNESKHGI
jgi:hypothetical protein